MRSHVAFLLLIALVLSVLQGSWRQSGGGPTVEAVDPSVPMVKYHGMPVTAARPEYPYEPHANTAIVVAGGHQSAYSVYFDELKDMFNGEGFWTDSTAFHGLLLRTTFAVPVDSITETRTTTYMNEAELREIAGYGADQFEVIIDVPTEKTFGWRGKNGAAQVTYGAVTGMSREYVQTALASWQNGLLSKIGRASRGLYHDRYQLGFENTLFSEGILYGVVPEIHLQNVQTAYNAIDGYATDAPLSDMWPGMRFSLMGVANRWLGWHEIGSDTPIYRLGARLWDATNDPSGTPDSAGIAVDVAVHGRCTWMVVFDGQFGASGGQNIPTASLRSVLAHIARRCIEDEVNGHDRLTTITTDQLRHRKEGRRAGAIFDTDGFAVLCTTSVGGGTGPNPYDYGRKPSKLYRAAAGGIAAKGNVSPVMMSMATQHFGGGTSDSTMTPGRPVGVGASLDNRPSVQNLVVDGDSIALAAATAADVSYGHASPTGNVLMNGFQDNARGRPIYLQFPTTGCGDGTVWLDVQFLVNSAVTTPFVSCSLYVSYFFGQFDELQWDHMNEGPSSGHLTSVLERYRQGPDTTAVTGAILPDSLIHKMRFVPQFAGWWVLSDTTAAASSIAQNFDHNANGWNWAKQLLSKSTWELIPAWVGPDVAVASGAPDLRGRLGNPKNLKLPAVGGHETYMSDVVVVKEKGKLYSTRIPIDVNARTALVGGFLVIENAAGTMSAIPTTSWTGLTAYF